MYNAKIVTDNGDTFNFGYEYGILFDIDPLNGIDVNISKSQGFQQIGETVESQSVIGISRTIKGVIFDNLNQNIKNMLSILTMFTAGKLYFNDTHFCDIYISKTPSISKPMNKKVNFTMMIYCPIPYWLDVNIRGYVLGGWTPEFSFPVTYNNSGSGNPHIFGIHDSNVFINCYNPGDVKQPLSIEFTTHSESTTYGIVNVNTMESILIQDTLSIGETVFIKNMNGKLSVIKKSAEVITNIFYKLRESSTLFWAVPGDNIFKIVAFSGRDQIKASVSFYPGYVGVFDEN